MNPGIFIKIKHIGYQVKQLLIDKFDETEGR